MDRDPIAEPVGSITVFQTRSIGASISILAVTVAIGWPHTNGQALGGAVKRAANGSLLPPTASAYSIAASRQCSLTSEQLDRLDRRGQQIGVRLSISGPTNSRCSPRSRRPSGWRSASTVRRWN